MEGKFRHTIVRSKRKTLSLCVTEKGEVVVRAPYRTSERTIDEFLLRHRAWIQKRVEEAQASPSLRLEDGNYLTLFGERVILQTGRAALDLAGGTLYLPKEERKNALIGLLQREAYGKIEKLVSEFSLRNSFPLPKIRISKARTRWGSCNRSGTLSFSCFLAFVPHEEAEYVVVHELCHTREFNHSAAFWREVEGILPDYRERRRALKQYIWVLKS